MSRPRANLFCALVDYPLTRPTDGEPFPWRAAALVASAVAAVELILLVLVGGTLIAKPDAAPRQAKAAAAASSEGTPAAKKEPPAKAAPAALPRRKVSVMVLNGNGRTGAASAAAARVKGRGYRIGTVGNAPRQDYPRSIVMYRKGFAAEGERLARDLRIALVGPLDGMRPGQLKGAHAVLILGSSSG